MIKRVCDLCRPRSEENQKCLSGPKDPDKAEAWSWISPSAPDSPPVQIMTGQRTNSCSTVTSCFLPSPVLCFLVVLSCFLLVCVFPFYSLHFLRPIFSFLPHRRFLVFWFPLPSRHFSCRPRSCHVPSWILFPVMSHYFLFPLTAPY